MSLHDDTRDPQPNRQTGTRGALLLVKLAKERKQSHRYGTCTERKRAEGGDVRRTTPKVAHLQSQPLSPTELEDGNQIATPKDEDKTAKSKMPEQAEVRQTLKWTKIKKKQNQPGKHRG